MEPAEFGGIGVTTYLLVSFLKKILGSSGAIVLVLALLIGVGISEVEVIATLPEAATRQQTIRAFLDGFFRGVMVAALASGIHSATKTAEDDGAQADRATVVTTDVAAAATDATERGGRGKGAKGTVIVDQTPPAAQRYPISEPGHFGQPQKAQDVASRSFRTDAAGAADASVHSTGSELLSQGGSAEGERPG